jgi:hypothetical protein
MQLFTQVQSVERSEFKTIITTEFVVVPNESIEWRWEAAGEFGYKGYVPYVNGNKLALHKYAPSMYGDKRMFTILDDDKRVFSEHYKSLGLVKPN